MITFTRVQAERVAALRQTRTTRLGRKRWQVNGIHEVRAGRQGKVVCFVRILGIHPIHLGDITDEDARAEGFSDLAGMKRHWRETYGPWRSDTEAWVVRFAVVPRPERYSQATLFEEV